MAWPASTPVGLRSVWGVQPSLRLAATLVSFTGKTKDSIEMIKLINRSYFCFSPRFSFLKTLLFIICCAPAVRGRCGEAGRLSTSRPRSRCRRRARPCGLCAAAARRAPRSSRWAACGRGAVTRSPRRAESWATAARARARPLAARAGRRTRCSRHRAAAGPQAHAQASEARGGNPWASRQGAGRDPRACAPPACAARASRTRAAAGCRGSGGAGGGRVAACWCRT